MDDTYNLSRCHLYLGDSLRQIGQLAEAKEHLELARVLIDEKVDEQYERGRVYLCLAKLYHQMGETYWAEAVKLAERSRDFHIARGNQMKLAQSLCHLGRLYADLGQYDEARFCYDDAISLSQEPGVRNSYYEVTAMVNLCELHLTTGRPDHGRGARPARQRNAVREHEYYQAPGASKGHSGRNVPAIPMRMRTVGTTERWNIARRRTGMPIASTLPGR